MAKSILKILKEVKAKLDNKKVEKLEESRLNFHWETPNQKKAFLDAFEKMTVVDYPIPDYKQSYAEFLSKRVASEVQISEEDVDNTLKESCLNNPEYKWDPVQQSLSFYYDNYCVTGLYSEESGFWKVWIENKALKKIVYQCDYDNETRQDESISDDEVDELLDILYDYLRVEKYGDEPGTSTPPPVSRFVRNKRTDDDSDV